MNFFHGFWDDKDDEFDDLEIDELDELEETSDMNDAVLRIFQKYLIKNGFSSRDALKHSKNAYEFIEVFLNLDKGQEYFDGSDYLREYFGDYFSKIISSKGKVFKMHLESIGLFYDFLYSKNKLGKVKYEKALGILKSLE